MAEGMHGTPLHARLLLPLVVALLAACGGGAAALPPALVQGVIDGSIKLDDPQTTLALLSLDAVLGVQGQVSKGIFTGAGDAAHEPVDPTAYWNRYVGVAQMHGHGTFSDARLIISGKPLKVDHRVAGDDRISAILPQLEAYQWSIAAPAWRWTRTASRSRPRSSGA